MCQTPHQIPAYKIAGIQDPFGRTCTFTYDSAVENLIEVTDAIGMKSQFAWNPSTSFISQMTTEYGTTSFYNYVPGIDLVPARALDSHFQIRQHM
ncbi:MAG: hypothetical protein IPO31_00045 [Candidatus Obscuribacter sp.]|nr:hypothetical protein [Candidatus Obscuribacter sp.]